MLKVDFIGVCNDAVALNSGIIVTVVLPDLASPEIIINPEENVVKKMEYYDNAYNEFMNLKANESIFISKIDILPNVDKVGEVNE